MWWQLKVGCHTGLFSWVVFELCHLSHAPLFLCDSSMSRASCNRWLITGWPGLCSSWPSAEAHWLFHTTWSPKTRPPKPVIKWKQRTRPQLLCPVKVPMNHISSFYSSHSSLTVFLNVAMWYFLHCVLQPKSSSTSKTACLPRTPLSPFSTWRL